MSRSDNHFECNEDLHWCYWNAMFAQLKKNDISLSVYYIQN